MVVSNHYLINKQIKCGSFSLTICWKHSSDDWPQYFCCFHNLWLICSAAFCRYVQTTFLILIWFILIPKLFLTIDFILYAAFVLTDPFSCVFQVYKDTFDISEITHYHSNTYLNYWSHFLCSMFWLIHSQAFFPV